MPVTPNSATTTVSNLKVAGTYVFNIDVHDSTNATTRQLYLIVYATNPPPALWQPGFRFRRAVRTRLRQSARHHAREYRIADLRNHLTSRHFRSCEQRLHWSRSNGAWSAGQAGANVALGSTYYIYISIRCGVTNMTVPGDYLFQLDVTNPGQSNLTAQILCTVHDASSPPAISSVTASPNNLMLPASTSQLAATTSDSLGNLLRHWWAVTTLR